MTTLETQGQTQWTAKHLPPRPLPLPLRSTFVPPFARAHMRYLEEGHGHGSDELTHKNAAA